MIKEFDQDTIAAIATAPGAGAIGVIRLSGPQAVAIAERLFQSRSGKKISAQKSYTAQLGKIISVSGANAETVDEVLALVMRAPKTFTGEDVVEISAHGGPAVLNRILELALTGGARLAQKGEFTKRAFLNGKIDLLQAEAVLDMVSAKTQMGRLWAASELEGALSKRIRAAKDETLNLLTHLEASIDFPDDFPETDSYRELCRRAESLCAEFKNLLDSYRVGALAKSALKVVIAGRPNVGKSSLMNALARTNRVIVTPIPGTTRDVVEEELEIGGFPVRLVDTAGIHETDHPIEKEGIERSKLAAGEADLILYLIDATQPNHPADRQLLQDLGRAPKIIVLNKVDLMPAAQMNEAIACSCVKPDGTQKLEEEILRFIKNQPANEDVPCGLSTIRQKKLVEEALAAMRAVSEGLKDNRSPELVAVDVRVCLDQLGLLVGEILNDDMLEILFNQFCIGK